MEPGLDDACGSLPVGIFFNSINSLSSNVVRKAAEEIKSHGKNSSLMRSGQRFSSWLWSRYLWCSSFSVCTVVIPSSQINLSFPQKNCTNFLCLFIAVCLFACHGAEGSLLSIRIIFLFNFWCPGCHSSRPFTGQFVLDFENPLINSLQLSFRLVSFISFHFLNFKDVCLILRFYDSMNRPLIN